MAVVLASASPRRQELLRRVGLSDFLIIPPDCDETVPEGILPAETVMRLARRKADAVADTRPMSDLVIAADTLVYLGKQRLGKPRGRAEAIRMLTRLSGRTHEVYTGVTVCRGDRVMTSCAVTDVTFKELTAGQIAAYVDTGEPMDKAGAYGIQERGALIVARIDGDFYNVMGLPLCLLGDMLATFGISLLGG